MAAIIRVSHLFKRFGEINAVDDLSFTVEEGKVYGFLGQNGAGKSTTIRMLLTLVQPDSGEIEIFGLKLSKHRKEILQQTGAIIEKPDLYKYLTALENISIFSKLSGVKVTQKQMMEQLEMVGLADRARSKVRTYSQGMKQRLGLACALIHQPRLIILDEPVNGLDPQGIADMRTMIIHLSKNLGKTLFVSSHQLSEMEMVADNMLIIHKGRKIVEGKVAELLHPEEPFVELVTENMDAAIRFIRTSEWQMCLQESGDNRLKLKLAKNKIPELNRQLVQKGIPVISLRPLHSLEEYFLSQTKE